ncbi:TolB-like translocation protein [Tellurirhabdus bombi]|uniref:hypothetical protein n=1 Tax=Tellurirhabdus bombi TaxID=2907205 RepID=UPI001F29D11A|nr:hypothetical protein [Tellurirhabdus bombi]
MRHWLTAALLVSALSVQAQLLMESEQNPTRLKWYTLRSPHFKLLYPEGMDSTANQTISRLEHVYEPVSKSLGRRPRRLPVLLQNQTTVSNGFVTLLPRRSEFFTTPPQAPFLSGTLNWLDQLALHEYRHVVQYEKGLTGISGVLYHLFGNATLAGISIGMPDWFAEGDAVGAETVLSRSGRGRIPEFDMGFRANLLAGRRFSYPKAVAGSYRDNVPNHYVSGYFLTTKLKREHGADAWSKILTYYYNFPFYPFSFSNAVKRTTGYRVETLYRRTIDELTEDWQNQQRELKLTEATPYATDQNRSFTNYRYPQFIDGKKIIALKSGLGDIEQLVLLSPDGSEQRLHFQGLFNNPDQLSAANGKIVWIEYTPDLRWGQRIFSDIKRLDVATGKVDRLTTRQRYTTVSLSPDGSKLIATRSEEDGRTRLVVLDATSGQEIRTLNNTLNAFYQHPRWKEDNRTIVVVRLAAKGKALEEINTETSERRLLTPEGNENLSHPQPWREWVFYNSPRSGIDNIYAVNTRNGEQFQVTSRPLGAFHAAVSSDGTKLAFHDFSVDGHRVVSMPLEPKQWRPIREIRDQSIRYFGPIVKQDAGIVDFDTVNTGTAVTKKRYNRLANVVNIYSWGPLANSDGQTLTLGVQSLDLLGTTSLAAAYVRNANERTNGFRADLSYRALYPIIDVGLAVGQRRTSAYTDRREPLDSLQSDLWNYTQLTAGLRLPLRLTRSRFQQNASLSAYYNYQGVRGYELPVRFYSEVGGSALHYMNYGASYDLLMKQSKRDVAPRWGLALSGSLRNTPFSPGLRAQNWAVNGSVFLPGIGKHHSLRFRGGYQQQWGLTDANPQHLYRFSGAVFYPRSVPYVAYDRLQTASAEYRLPLLNPHWAIGRWIYIQRIKGMVFTDVARGESRLPLQNGQFRNVLNNEQVVGADVSFVFNPLRLRTNLEAGVRTIYNVKTARWNVDLLVVDIGF